MVAPALKFSVDLKSPRPQRMWRWLIPIFLVLLFLAILFWLPWQSRQMETNERQDQLIADTLWVEQAISFQLKHDEENSRLIASEIVSQRLTPKQFQERGISLLKNSSELHHLIWVDANDHIIATSTTNNDTMPIDSTHAIKTAQQAHSARVPQYSPPYKMAAASSTALTDTSYIDYSVPLYADKQYLGSLISTYATASILNELVPWWFAQDNQIELIDTDDVVIASRASGGVGRNIYTHRRPLDLPGLSLILLTNSTKSAPKFLPNLLVGSVIVLALGLLWSLLALWRDIHRRLATEDALRHEVAFRSAMENSLVTGLRARDLEGRVTYVNPAFCDMVGMRAEDIIGKSPPMSYWAPEIIEKSQERFAKVMEGELIPQFETLFQRPNGERFPVLVLEAPLVDASGHQTGWMGSMLDISERRRTEELTRRQQEKLQASARLVSMGEIASTLAHELNQPLAAISSYTAGAINLIESIESSAAEKTATTETNNQEHAPQLMEQLHQALSKAQTQAQRAGQIIRSVHQFIKQREPSRELLTISTVIDNIMPLVELQAQASYVTVQVHISPNLPSVLADHMLLEQVLLNLTRNGIEAMANTAPNRRLLIIKAKMEAMETSIQNDRSSAQVLVSVSDQGQGISDDVAERLFSPFYSTKAHGMGMGLNICRTAIELHGGTLTHADNLDGGTIFQFSLPAHFLQ